MRRQQVHFTDMTKRANKRPGTFKKPAHWTDEPPPEPKAAKMEKNGEEGLEPTRYGDWVKNGIAVDF